MILKTEKEYELALKRIEKLMDAEVDTPEGDELVRLADMAEAYEDEHYPIPLPDPIDAIQFRMEQLGFRQKDLVEFIGSRSKVSEVLNRKRPLSLNMIRALNRELGIPAEVLLQETGTELSEDIEQCV